MPVLSNIKIEKAKEAEPLAEPYRNGHNQPTHMLHHSGTEPNILRCGIFFIWYQRCKDCIFVLFY
jgi:hypothetical protein